MLSKTLTLATFFLRENTDEIVCNTVCQEATLFPFRFSSDFVAMTLAQTLAELKGA